MSRPGFVVRGKLTPYLYVFPVVVVVLAVFVYPLVSIFRYSLTTEEGPRAVYVGLANFKFVASDAVFWKSLQDNLTLLLAVPILTVLSLVVAIALYERMRGWRFYRGLIFMPFVMPPVVIGIVFIYLLQRDGIVNTILESIGLKAIALDWLGNPSLALPSLMGIIIWQQLGFGIVLFLAAMLNLPAMLNEAAKLDGANWFQEHFYVTVPQLKPVLAFFVVNEAITMISWVFNYVYVVTGGGPGFATSVLELYIWKNAFSFHAYGIASAVAVILFIITVAVMMFGLRGIFGDERERK